MTKCFGTECEYTERKGHQCISCLQLRIDRANIEIKVVSNKHYTLINERNQAEDLLEQVASNLSKKGSIAHAG